MLTFTSKIGDIRRPDTAPIPNAPVGFGDELYPNGFDQFVQISQNGHYHVAKDIQVLFDCIQAIQNELGIGPAGTVSTIRARLERSGNLDLDKAKWKYINVSYSNIENRQIAKIDNSLIGLTQKPLSTGVAARDYGIADNGWGLGQPVVFARGLRIVGTDDWGHDIEFNKPSCITIVDTLDREFGNLWGQAARPNGHSPFSLPTLVQGITLVAQLRINFQMRWNFGNAQDPNAAL